jgi:hypothetical protein
MRDIDLVEKAIADALAVLHVYIEAGPRSAEDSMQRLLAILDREDLVAALERLKQGYGPRAVK